MATSFPSSRKGYSVWNDIRFYVGWHRGRCYDCGETKSVKSAYERGVARGAGAFEICAPCLRKRKASIRGILAGKY